MYSIGFGKYLVIFVQKCLFWPLLKEMGQKTLTFWWFLKNTIFFLRAVERVTLLRFLFGMHPY